jgi:hypothetical protein
MRRPTRPPRERGPPECVTLTIAVLGLTSLITHGDALGWTTPTAQGLVAVTVARLAAFVLVERFHPDPRCSTSRCPRSRLLGCEPRLHRHGYWPFMIYLPRISRPGYNSAAAGLAQLGQHSAILVMPPIASALPGALGDPHRPVPDWPWFHVMKLGSALSYMHGVVWRADRRNRPGLTSRRATSMATTSVPTNRASMAPGMTSGGVSSLLLSYRAVLVAGIWPRCK